MRVDWVPYSAAALVVGAAALSVGALMLPQGGLLSSPLLTAEEHSASWLAVSGLYALASVGVILGLPAILSIFDLRGARAALVAAACFVVACIGTTAYAVLLAVYRALSAGELVGGGLADLAGDAGLSVILYAWLLAFAVGELALAFALVRARRVPRWVAALLVVHAGLSPLAPVLPHLVAVVVALLVTIAFAALGIVANQRAVPH